MITNNWLRPLSCFIYLKKKIKINNSFSMVFKEKQEIDKCPVIAFDKTSAAYPVEPSWPASPLSLKIKNTVIFFQILKQKKV